MDKLHRNRITKIKSRLENDRSAAMILESAPAQIRSRDTSFPYRQDSNFYYLTGSEIRSTFLVISSSEKKPVLITPKTDRSLIVWEGKGVDATALASSLGATLIHTVNPKSDLLKLLKNIEILYHTNTVGSLLQSLVADLMNRQIHLRSQLPKTFSHAEVLLEDLRIIKDAEEIRLIKKAGEISGNVLRFALPLIHPGVTEHEIAATIDYGFRMDHCYPAFGTIVAAGPSAATLHYHAHSRRLNNEDLLLVDWGAEQKLYAADQTRVFPVSGKFSALQKELYSIVLESQLAAIDKVKDGVPIGDAYNAAARILTVGLIELGVLRGKTSKLMAKGAFKPYFPHGIGHSLGLDVHDIGNLRGNNKAPLRKGMVITIEPGLYFPKKIGRVPACGIRIEDDVHITSGGSEVLSPFPKSIDEIETLMQCDFVPPL